MLLWLEIMLVSFYFFRSPFKDSGWKEFSFLCTIHPSKFKDAFESQGNEDLMLSSALRSQTKKLCKYRELLGIICLRISSLSIIRVLEKLMKKWALAYWQQQSLLERLRDLLHWGMQESVKTLTPKFLSFFLQMKTTKDENPLQYEKERIKVFLNQTPVGRGQSIVCVCTYLHRR